MSARGGGWMRVAALAAVAAFAAAVVAAVVATDGWSQLQHPLALPGARGLPAAPLFNLLAFGVPAAVAAAVALAWRARLADSAPFALRLGSRLLLLSALAFAAQGLWPLDPRELDAGDSRFHAAAWIAWTIATATGLALHALGARGRARAWPLLLLVLVLAMLLAPQSLLAAGIAQRLVFAAWFGWWLPLAWRGRGQPPL